MKIIIMKCYNKKFWYNNKIGKTYKVEKLSYPAKDYITKDGIIRKEDAEEIS
ncbi:hypothetical protein [Clostridium botulinum]|uniref:hypothetical protein n=1 Tax=Clostridium botulinum TaxID=1491 RepID=UPI001C9AF0CE|nr:hypothetical protein [Clostridium botulinum]MBY6900219.1 hypothetical protein [Clostridium botulinum]MBY6914332.1 hypothetical protein [Clostridium botulinum]